MNKSFRAVRISRSWSFLAIATILLGASLLVAPRAGIAQALFNHNSNAPVDYSAASIELQDKQNRVLLSGDVVITQAGLRLTSQRMIVAYHNSGGLEIDQINATGGVFVTKGNETARGDSGVYDLNRRIITLVGNVQLRQAGNTLNGGRLVIDLVSGRSTVDGRSSGGSATGSKSGGRVSGTFSVPKRD